MHVIGINKLRTAPFTPQRDRKGPAGHTCQILDVAQHWRRCSPEGEGGPGASWRGAPHLQSSPLPTHFLLGQAVGYVGGDSVPDVRGEQSSSVVLRLNTGRAHLLPPRGHWLRIPGLFDGHYRQKGKVKKKKLLAGRLFFFSWSKLWH